MIIQIRKRVSEMILWITVLVCGFSKEYNRMTKFIYNKVLLQKFKHFRLILDKYATRSFHTFFTLNGAKWLSFTPTLIQTDLLSLDKYILH